MTTKRSHSAESNLCRFSFSDGRRCRMLCISRSGLCLFHARDEQQLLECRSLGSELSASLTGHFYTAADINHVLGKVFTALAQNRIPPRNAAVLACIARVLLHSIPAVKAETKFHYTYDAWARMFDNSLPLSDPPDLAAQRSAANPSAPDSAAPGVDASEAPVTEPPTAPPAAETTVARPDSHNLPEYQQPAAAPNIPETSDADQHQDVEEPQPV